MNNAVFSFEMPKNETILSYAKGSAEREDLLKELERQENLTIEIPLIIGGKEIKTGNTDKVVMPHNRNKVIAIYHKAGEK
ncbi:MAG TPA: 1-pyrroline-5-carboxylate dehydrogenase, partial [Bacteroidales bacterium]|nr:1-pyrroline-5-carboxylate dehydrogenase [Bacteroidales bacterium]